MVWENRKRESEYAARESAGESLWVAEVSEQGRLRVLAFLGARFSTTRTGYGMTPLESFAGAVAQHLALATGAHLGGQGSIWRRLRDYFQVCETDRCLSILELMEAEFRQRTGSSGAFENQVREILRSERSAFDLIDGQVIERQSEELHASVVAPSLRLLNGRQGWESVERAYQDALDEDDPSDAITDAGTALQEALRAVGAQGNSFSPLIRDAIAKGLLVNYDQNMVGAIKGLVDWVGADRSTKGDGHNATNASPEDAWLAIHVVGALIFRLAGGDPRSTT